MTACRRTGAVLLVIAFVVGALATALATDRADAAGRTWVVDAVDDLHGSRWLAADTGTTEVTVQVGDTVEWQFDQAVVDHDLTSQDTRSGWGTAIAEYRSPGGEPVRHTFTAPGTYDYFCSIHGTVMRGTVVVLAPDPENRPPTATPSVDPTSGPAPLDVHFTATGQDPDGDPLGYHWAFGTGAGDDGQHVSFRYDTPGTYTATLTVSDGRGGTAVHHVPITVTSGGPGPTPTDPPDPGPLPAVTATAAPVGGAAPLAVALSAEVATAGTFAAYADGVATYPDLTGTAGLVRARGRTTAHLDVGGLAPGGAHLVHVHEQACSVGNGGAHFRFDETRPFSAENEIWLPFTADAAGRSGRVEAVQPVRAGAKAVSIVIHDPVNPAKRIGCADLAPGTAGLTYAWDFGDGTSGTGSDPDHVYAAPGTYLATVTVARAGQHHPVVTASVRVVAGARPTPQTAVTGGPVGSVRSRTATFALAGGTAYECRLDRALWGPCASPVRFTRLLEGRHVLEVRAADATGTVDPTPAVRWWTVDTTAPAIRLVDRRRPEVRIAVRDRLSAVRRGDVVVRVDGRVVRTGVSARPGGLTLRRTLGPGRHLLVVEAADAAGNRRVVRWRLR